MKRTARALPLWKKISFTVVACVIAAPPLYLACEIAYRGVHGIPIRLSSRAFPDDSRPLADTDTSVMDFQSVFYYEIFRKSANPILYYEPKPGFSKGAVRINSHGFRDHEYSARKPAGSTRIVVLGDSIIWGHGLVLEDTFAKQLEVLLNDRLEGTFEVLNFGVAGYSLQQEVEQYIVRASQFDPDVVILGLCINDYLYSSVEGDFFTAKDGGLFAKSYFVNSLILTKNLILDKCGVPQRYLQNIVDVRTQMERFQEASSDVKRLVLMFPQLQDLEDYRGHRDHTILTQPARDVGFTVRDLLGDFRKWSTQPPGIDYIHPNRFGNKIAAEAAYDALIGNAMISPKAKVTDTTQE